MLTLTEEYIHEIEIKKSRFICHMNYVKDEKAAQAYIAQINGQHKAATHNCTAYKCGAHIKVDDDGEPTGTAGLPMLEVLNHHDFDHICVVVTRYFGGTKLGAGGLIRAYAKSVSEAIKTAPVQTLVPGNKIRIKTSYSDTKPVEYYLETSKLQLENKEYEMDVRYTLLVDEKQYEDVCTKMNDINHLIEVKELENILIAKQD